MLVILLDAFGDDRLCVWIEGIYCLHPPAKTWSAKFLEYSVVQPRSGVGETVVQGLRLNRRWMCSVGST
jgi:hypothetical protein